MHNFFLRGIAEGVAGRSSIIASSLDDVFVQIPTLSQIREKLVICGNMISGFSPCDG